MERRLYPKQPIVGVGAIIICDGKILLEKRTNEPGKGKWSVPGGLVEVGEKAEQAVIREVKEETGLDVEKPVHIDVVDNIIRDASGDVKYHFIILDYFMKLKGGKLEVGSDAGELKWVALHEVEKYNLTITFREFFLRNKAKLATLDSKA